MTNQTIEPCKCGDFIPPSVMRTLNPVGVILQCSNCMRWANGTTKAEAIAAWNAMIQMEDEKK